MKATLEQADVLSGRIDRMLEAETSEYFINPEASRLYSALMKADYEFTKSQLKHLKRILNVSFDLFIKHENVDSAEFLRAAASYGLVQKQWWSKRRFTIAAAVEAGNSLFASPWEQFPIFLKQKQDKMLKTLTERAEAAGLGEAGSSISPELSEQLVQAIRSVRSLPEELWKILELGTFLAVRLDVGEKLEPHLVEYSRSGNIAAMRVAEAFVGKAISMNRFGWLVGSDQIEQVLFEQHLTGDANGWVAQVREDAEHPLSSKRRALGYPDFVVEGSEFDVKSRRTVDQYLGADQEFRLDLARSASQILTAVDAGYFSASRGETVTREWIRRSKSRQHFTDAELEVAQPFFKSGNTAWGMQALAEAGRPNMLAAQAFCDSGPSTVKLMLADQLDTHVAGAEISEGELTWVSLADDWLGQDSRALTL